MWRNAEVLDFVGWLRAHNDAARPAADAVGFYGLDLYSLAPRWRRWSTTSTVSTPAAASRARRATRASHPFGGDTAGYGQAVLLGRQRAVPTNAVLEQLVELRASAGDYLRHDGLVAEDDYFYAEQNARWSPTPRSTTARCSRPRTSWNLRDRHMADTLDSCSDASRPPRRRRPRSSCGRTTPTSATRARPRWPARRAQPRPAHARAQPATPCSSASRPTRNRDGRVGVGRAGGAQARAARAARQLRGAVPRAGIPASCCARWHSDSGPRCASPGWSGRSASSTGPRPNARATSSPPASAQFDALMHIDETRAVEPLERAGRGSSASCPRPTRQRFDQLRPATRTQELRARVGCPR